MDEYELIWQSVNSFVEENEVITTASEYVIMSEEGKIISVLDLALGLVCSSMNWNKILKICLYTFYILRERIKLYKTNLSHNIYYVISTNEFHISTTKPS